MVPQLWPTLALHHKILIPILVVLPHYYLYRTATISSAIPLPPHQVPRPPPSPTSASTPPNTLDFGPAHTAAMHAYPYDYLLYHPGYFCSTCRFPKPARSKHCSLCGACIQKQDHHCIWVNNCVGRLNYGSFLCLLVAITTLLIYGTGLGWQSMSTRLTLRFSPTPSSPSWSTKTTWSLYFDRLAWAMVADIRIGATTLLCAMCTPLGGAFLVYHAYLLWAGMTTNEQGKWADWKEDVHDELVFRARIAELRSGIGGVDAADFQRKERAISSSSSCTAKVPEVLGAYPPLPSEIEPHAQDVDWPPRRIPVALWTPHRDHGHAAEGEDASRVGKASWWYIHTRYGDQPVVKMTTAEARVRGLAGTAYPVADASRGGGNGADGRGNGEVEVEVDDLRWQRVRSMRREMDNVYDLGLWGNLMEVIYHGDA